MLVSSSQSLQHFNNYALDLPPFIRFVHNIVAIFRRNLTDQNGTSDSGQYLPPGHVHKLVKLCPLVFEVLACFGRPNMA